MSQYYLPAKLSKYVDERGGRDFLASLVEAHMDGDVRDVPKPVLCPDCGVRLQGGRLPCFHCGRGIR